MATQRGRRTTRRVVHDPDYEYGVGASASEQEIIPSSQNTVVSEQNDSDSSYHENTPTPPGEEENVCDDRDDREEVVVATQDGEQSSSEENEIDQSPKARWLRKWKRLDPGLCCVCLDGDATKDNVLVYCDGKKCDVVVHQECYGITILPKKEDPWYCDTCLTLPSDSVRCVLCPNKNGAFRKISASDEIGDGSSDPIVWVHILCAFWMPGMHIGSASDLRDIQVVNVDPKNWGKKCHVCNSEEGAAIHCDAGQCKNWVHATCAVAYGLTEYVDEENISDPYFIYCKQHGPNDHPRQNKIEKWIRMRDEFLIDERLKRSEDRSSRLQDGDPGQNFLEIFEDAYARYTSQRELRITEARRQIVQQVSKHNGLIDAKEKAEKNVRDFRAKIPTVKVENAALKNYLEKANEAVLSLIPHMRNVQVEIRDGDSTSTKIETLMEAMTGKTNIRWSKAVKRTAKSIKVRQLNTNEVRSLNLKSVVNALARAAKEERKKARQRGRRSGVKSRGRPKTPNKGKEKAVENQEEIPEGTEGDEQRTPKRTTRSRAASVKGKEKFVEDEGDAQKGLPADNSNTSPKKVPRLRIVSRPQQMATELATQKKEPKRKHAEQPTQNELSNTTTEVQSKKKRVQENPSTTATPTDTTATPTDTTEVQVGQANTETLTKKKRSKRKRVEDVSYEDVSYEEDNVNNADEQTQADPSNQVSVLADEATQSAPAKRQYNRRTRKPANKGKKKADEQDSALNKAEQATETIQSVQDNSSSTSTTPKRTTKRTRKTTKSNESAENTTNTNDVSNRTSRRTGTKGKGKVTAEPKSPTKLRPIAPKASESANVLTVEEKSEGSTFPVVLNISKPKNDAVNTYDNNDTSNDVVTTTSTHGDVTTFDHSSHQVNVNKFESNEESFSNTRSGGVIGISTLLNPIEDTPSSTSTIYETSAQSYFYDALNSSTTNQSYFGGSENLYQTTSTPSNNIPVQSTGYGGTTTMNTGNITTPFQSRYFVTESSSNQTSFRVPESGFTSYSHGGPSTYSSPYTVGSATTYTSSFGPTSTNTFASSSYAQMNQSSPATFYASVNESRTITSTFTNEKDNVSALTATNTPDLNGQNNGLDMLLSATKLLELEKNEPFVVKEKNESIIVKEKDESIDVKEKDELIVAKEKDESLVVKEKDESLVVKEKDESLVVKEKDESFVVKEESESFVVKEESESFVVKEESESFVVKEDNESFVVKDDNEEVQDEAMTETLQIQSQTPDTPTVSFYGGTNTGGQLYSDLSSEVATSYQPGSVFSFPGPSPTHYDSAVTETSSESSKENDPQNVETVSTQDEGTNEESVALDTANSEESTAQNTVTKPRRRRGPTPGTKKKAGRKPKVKLLEEEATQLRAPVPQPTCTVCTLVFPPANDQPSATYVTPQRARESMLLKGRDKVNRMVRCGYCSKWYHLACMVPPRKTMPTGGYVWRCAECDLPSSVASTGDSPAEPSGGWEAPSVPTIPPKKWNLRSAAR